jgi:NADPH:quinone reductase-like Zn-dependent oxidoreductase
VFELRTESDPIPMRAEVRIRVEAAGINWADVMARLGLYPGLPRLPVVIGFEVAGRVDQVGVGVDESWVGRDVFALTPFGGYSDVVCVPEINVYARPDGMTALEGAAIPVCYLTALQLVVVMGSTRPGDTVLVHSAGGGVGVAVTQLAKHAGATVIGTASRHKHEFLRSLGVDHCLDPRTDDVPARVREITDGRGVELALDPIGGASLRQSFEMLAPTGRLGIYGMSSAAAGKSRRLTAVARALVTTPWWTFTPSVLVGANKGVFGVHLGKMWGEADRVGGWAREILALYTEGVVRPVVDRTFPLERVADAHHFLQDRQNRGKVLLTMG